MSRSYVFSCYGGPENEKLIERTVPVPGPGQVAVEVRAAGVNPVDWKIREGLLGRATTPPVPMGREVAGVVTAAGEGVRGLPVGAEVLGTVAPGDGGLADHALLESGDAVVKPEDISFAEAAIIPVAGTAAYDLTHHVELEPGQTLLILGAAGGVGHLAAQIGAVHEFRVIGVAAPDKRELVEATGATFVPAGVGARDTVRALAPDGVDLFVDLVGGQSLRELATLARRPEAILSAADPATATGLGGSGRLHDPQTLRKMTDVVGYRVVVPRISATYPLVEAGKAIAAVASGHTGGKVVVVP